MKIILANPRGFCAGVERAIDTVEQLLALHGAPIYVRHEIVHNKHVVENLSKKGVVFVDELAEVPDDSLVVFSAHGVAKSVYAEAKERKLSFIDATCPLVRKVHFSVAKHDRNSYKVIFIGHKNHAEVIGTMGQLAQGKVTLVETLADVENLDFKVDEQLAYTTQTTLSFYEVKDIIIALKKKYPSIKGPQKGDLCYATTNRQEAVMQVAPLVDFMIIVGSANSSNSTRLMETALLKGTPAKLVESADYLDTAWFKGVEKLGISSGASAPEILVDTLVHFLLEKFPGSFVESFTAIEEKVHFPLPVELRK